MLVYSESKYGLARKPHQRNPEERSHYQNRTKCKLNDFMLLLYGEFHKSVC